ncbi:hypothetical protein BJ165DRAFT_1527579 [Panaeolus papilionaceus]|nr:hypothetical protein BJ165DRAFT_1527579 [Panaeolus papilionaceus]
MPTIITETTPLLTSNHSYNTSIDPNDPTTLRQRVESAGSYSLGKQKAACDSVDNFESDTESASSHPSTLLTPSLDPKSLSTKGTKLPPKSSSDTDDCLWSPLGLLDNVSLRLENSGSVARDHLASERTFLAYMRTSLAIASSGVALVQLFATSSIASDASNHLGNFIRPLGASTVVVGLMVLFIGVVRYFTVQQALIKGQFPAARIATGFIAFAISVLVTITFGIMLTGRLKPFESKPLN